MHLPTRAARVRPVAFTLVELLVVIGIIALLISVLLPVLGSARRAAQAVKCEAALREIGNAFQMYAMENKQYYPPMRCITNYKISFQSVPAIVYDGPQTYWMYFLGKYISKSKFGIYTGVTAKDAAQSMRSILWGCPNFQPIYSSSTLISVGGIAMVYTGYGMNGYPEYTNKYPAVSATALNAIGDTVDVNACSNLDCNPAQNWSNLTRGRWYKQKAYTRPAERALVGDCRAYVLEAVNCPTANGFSPQADILALPATFWVSATSPALGESSYDYYRHGKYPPKAGPNSFATTGGKISYNVLFADGHVKTLISREEGFRAARMRFPG